MSRSSGRRAQVEPVPALVAVAMLGLALSAHTTVIDAAAVGPDLRSPTEPILRAMVDDLRDGAVVDPSNAEAAMRRLPADYRVRLTIRAEDRVWTVGPTPPGTGVPTAHRRLPVRIRPGLVRPGRVTVKVWR